MLKLKKSFKIHYVYFKNELNIFHIYIIIFIFDLNYNILIFDILTFNILNICKNI